MGRASQRKRNPDRGRHKRARETAIRGYVVDPSRSFESVVHAAAFHEAGHIVAALTLGFDVRFAILRYQNDGPQQGVDGYTATAMPALGPGGGSAEQAIAAARTPGALRVRTMQVLAGRIAESFVNDNTDDLDQGDAGDYQRALEFAQLALGPASTLTDWHQYLQDRFLEMRGQLVPLAATVRRVANHLIVHANENVPGDTLKGLVQEQPQGG